MKIQTEAYTRVKRARCGCSKCKAPAVAQFYVCALGGHVAVCAYHDWLLNLKAVLVATSNSAKEATPWMTKYAGPSSILESSPRGKRSSRGVSKRKKKLARLEL